MGRRVWQPPPAGFLRHAPGARPYGRDAGPPLAFPRRRVLPCRRLGAGIPASNAGPRPPRPETDPMPETPEGLLDRLARAGLAARTVHHPPLHTVAESKALRGELPGTHVKNLFLRAKSGGFWLVVLEEDRVVAINALARRLGAGRVSMGSAEELWAVLGVRPGAVTPLALVNAAPGGIRVVLDARLLRDGPVNVHPLVNTATTALAPEDLLAFLRGLGHAPEIVDLDAPDAPG